MTSKQLSAYDHNGCLIHTDHLCADHCAGFSLIGSDLRFMIHLAPDDLTAVVTERVLHDEDERERERGLIQECTSHQTQEQTTQIIKKEKTFCILF